MEINEIFKNNQDAPILKYSNNNFDIIGDIHGYSKELKTLLLRLGYLKENKVWQHPERKAVFIGDFIAKGPDSKGVIKIVRNMVEQGTAFAILGNHELNAIGYFTFKKNGKAIYSPDQETENQLNKIKTQYKNDTNALFSDIKWMRSLPFYIDFLPFRVAHAYWSNKNIKILRKNLSKARLSKKKIREIFKNKSRFARAIHQTTKGIVLSLPKELNIKNNKNIRQYNFRIKWWLAPFGKTFQELSYGNRFELPDQRIPRKILIPFEIYDSKQPLLFFGHYCISSEPFIVSNNACCIDNCIARGGALVAYRWNGHSSLSEQNFIFQKRLNSKNH